MIRCIPWGGFLGMAAPRLLLRTAQALGEPPAVALGVLRFVPAVGPPLLAVIGRLGFGDDLRTGGARPGAVRLDIVHVEEEALGVRAADRPRAPPVRRARSGGDHDHG